MKAAQIWKAVFCTLSTFKGFESGFWAGIDQEDQDNIEEEVIKAIEKALVTDVTDATNADDDELSEGSEENNHI